MSTQLVLYPQNYQGYSYGQPILQWLVDGTDFTQINTASGTTGQNNATDVIIDQFPSIVNTWYVSRSVSGMAYPTQISSNLVMYGLAGSTYTFTSAYQKLSNLVIGQNYKVTVNCQIGTATSTLHIVIKNGTTGAIINGSGANANITQLDATFVAQTTEDIVMVYFVNQLVPPHTDDSITIESISVTQASLTPTGIYTKLEDGQVICDLYEEENIPLTLSIDDFKNVAEKVQSYSKDFNLPATKRNNQIFNNMFEITRADDGLIFNPYVRTKCALKQDGFILFEGYLRLIDVKENEGEISYNVNLYSEVIALADTLKDRRFANLDFTELEHLYNRTQIERSWNTSGVGITYTNSGTSGFRNAYDTVKYPYIDWSHRLIVQSNGDPELKELQGAFRPCIQIKYLIDRIFAETDFNYTSDFFGTSDFAKLYMDFNWGTGNAPSASSQTVSAVYTSNSADNYAPNGSFGNLELTYPSGNLSQIGYSTTTNKFTSTADNLEYDISYKYGITNPTGSSHQYSARWLLTTAAGATTEIDLVPLQTITSGQTVTYQGSLFQSLDNGDTLEAQFYSNGTNVVAQDYDSISSQPLATSSVIITRAIPNITSNTLLHTLRGELGQWEFLKGLLTMFNLVTLADEDNPNNILIEPYSDVFIKNTNSGDISDLTLASRSIQHDWTDKVDVSEMELKPLTDLNKNTIFKFVEDDEDYCFNVFKSAQSGHLYGSLKYDASGFTILDGEEEIIAEPFAATVVKPLMEQFNDFIVPAVYAKSEDGASEGFDNSPRILYSNGKKTLTSCEYKIPAQNGVSEADMDEFLQFSHLSTIPSLSATSTDFLFASSQLVLGVGEAPIDNLYYTYWQPYFNELYNADTRIMTLKVNLNPSDIATFKFFDMVIIKNRIFRVNKIEYKPNSLAKVEFILIP
jgi:hypothetical protein